MIDPKSFTNAIRKWLPEVNDSCPNAIKIFVGTKSDMLTEYEYMLSQRGQPLTLPKELMEKKIKGLGYKLMTCSAMIQDNLTATFDEAIKMFLRSKNMSTIKKR